MLDIALIRKDPEGVRARLALRGASATEGLAKVLQADEERRKLVGEVEKLKSERNTISKEIGGRKAKGESADDLMAGMKEKSDRIAELDKKVAEVEAQQEGLLLSIPNLPWEGCPKGSSAADNPVVNTWGEPKKFDFKPKDHVTLGEALGMLDFTASAKISGSGFAVYKGAGAKLERSLISWMLNLHAGSHGYTEVSPPFLVREASMVGTGQLPKFREDMYATEGGELFLVPTAEVPVTNLHREEILTEADLPKRYAAYTPCFRKEAGSAGKETRGLARMHQFDKVELVWIEHPDRSMKALEELCGHAEAVLQKLGLHYRKIELCTGDIGFGAARCYDLEVWAPGMGQFLEVSSCSNFMDFQARRMGLRFKGADGKNRPCHTLNGSGTALARLFIALVETYQTKEGKVEIPEALRPIFGSSLIG
ncbi:MAG: serine--tRNA ligase [Verrucomicrobia bacterium]|nr:serine--tRNA ligase [Verrucomicrobiota bacterium]